MKIITLLCAVLLGLVVPSRAQNETGSLKGQVVDQARQAVSYATVALLRLPDSTVAGGVHTEDNGRFTFPAIAPGSYVLKIRYLGYQTSLSAALDIRSSHTTNAGVLILKENTRQLDEVLVQSTKPAVQYELDKTVFNISDELRSMSINATQVLENIPMVELDEEGVPSVMGQGVTVLIDGRPSRIYGDNIETVLKLIPSSTIENIEVITNPSARYTTEQGGIVLNIITKSEHLIGLSGTASVSANTNGGYNPSVNINLTRKHFGWTNNFSYEYDRDPFESSLLRENIQDSLFYTDQSRNGTDVDRDFSYHTNVYYELAPESRIGAFFGVGHDTENETEQLITRMLDSHKNEDRSYVRDITGHENSWQYNAGINFRQTFAGNKDHVLDFEAYYSTRDDDDDELFDQQSEWKELRSLQHQFTTSRDEGYTIDLDYVRPFSETSRLEAGFRAEWETDDNQFLPKYFDEDAGEYRINDSIRNDYTSRDQEFAVYAMYRTEFKGFSLQAGLRLEQERLNTKQRILDQDFHNEFLNLIPTFNLSYRFKNQDNLTFSYTRRADRPWWRQLDPFVDYSDPENISSGNPELKPEFDNSFEVRYGKFINQFNLYGAAFYRHTHSPIQRIRTVDDQGVSYTTYQNRGRENYFGIETGFSADIISDWNVRTNIGLRRNEVLGFDRQYRTWGFNGRFSTYFPLPLSIRGFAYLHYRGPRSVAQGVRKGMLYSDLGLRRSFFNNRGDVSLRLSDIFNQRRYAHSLITDAFRETSSYHRNSRYLRLTVSYLFGKLEGQQDHKDNAGPNGSGSDEGDQF